MNKQERERKIKFIEILLAVGSLLGVALTLSNVVQIWELSLIALCLFILFSLIYYNLITYNPLKRTEDISNLKTISFLIAISFSVLFSNVLSKPIINNVTLIPNMIQISVFSKIILGSVIVLIITFAYLCFTSYLIYKNLTMGINHKNRRKSKKKKDINR